MGHTEEDGHEACEAIPPNRRRPKYAEGVLKKLEEASMEESIIGFLDEPAPQTTANTVRLWSFNKPGIVRDTSKYRANTFGFYSINGKSVVRFHDHSKKGNIILFLKAIRKSIPESTIMVMLDNFRSQHSKHVKECAESLNIKLVFLPPYSPDLNPIEFIWKNVKRIVSIVAINFEDDLKSRIKDSFEKLSCSLTFAKSWILRFMNEGIKI